MAYVNNPHLLCMRYRFPKGAKDGKGRLLESIVLREVCSEDEDTAGRICAGDKAARYPIVLFQESVCALRYAGTDIDVEVDAPDPDKLGGWPTKTRDFALDMYRRLNQVVEADADAAAAAAESVDPSKPRTK